MVVRDDIVDESVKCKGSQPVEDIVWSAIQPCMGYLLNPFDCIDTGDFHIDIFIHDGVSFLGFVIKFLPRLSRSNQNTCGYLAQTVPTIYRGRNHGGVVSADVK